MNNSPCDKCQQAHQLAMVQPGLIVECHCRCHFSQPNGGGPGLQKLRVHSTSQEKPYNQTDHAHCWESTDFIPACGIKGEHRCCLCELPNPRCQEKSDREKFWEEGAKRFYGPPSEKQECPDCQHLLDGKNCPAGGVHDQPSEAWEEEFDSMNFTPFNKASGSRHLDEDKIKSFIRQKIAEAREEDAQIIQTLKDCIEGHKKLVPYFVEDGRSGALKECLEVIEGKEGTEYWNAAAYQFVYDKALSDLKQQITSLLENK